MTIVIMILCSLFISLLAITVTMAVEVYDIKNNHCRADVTHWLVAVFLCLVPALNITFLIGGCCLLIKRYLSDKGIIESVNEYLTKLVKGEKE